MKCRTGACSVASRSASVLAFFLSCLGLAPQELSAQGGTFLTAPTPVVVQGDRTLTVQWQPPADATASSIYDVRYGLGSSQERTELSEVATGVGNRYFVLPKTLTNGQAYKVQLRHRIGSASSPWSAEADGTPGDLASFAPPKGVAVGGWLDDDMDSDTFSVSALSSYRTVCYVRAEGLGSDLNVSATPSLADASKSYFGKWGRYVLATSGTHVITIGGGSASGSGYDLRCQNAPTDATNRANAHEIIDPGWPSDVRWGSQYDSYWYKVAVPEERYISARTLHYLDTVLTLYDSAGKEVARNDDGWELGNVWTSAIPPMPIAAGTYYLRVWFPRTGSYTDHTLFGDHANYRSIALSTEFIDGPDGFEGGVDRATASLLKVDGFLSSEQQLRVTGSGARKVLLEGASIRPQYGLLRLAGEADYWRFVVAGATTTTPIVIRGTAVRGSGLAAEVFNSDGDRLESVSYRRDSFSRGEDEGVGVDAFTVSGSFANGTHYLKVHSADRARTDVSYVLTAAVDREVAGFHESVSGGTSPCNNATPSGVGDPFFSCQWHLRQTNAINVTGAWGAGHSGSGVEVAVVDTGVDMEHVDLRVDRSKGVDLAGGTDPSHPTSTHGDSVAGIVSAKANSQGGRGVAHGSTVYGINYLSHGSLAGHVRAMTEHVATRGVSVHSYAAPSNGGLGRRDGTWFAATDHGVKEGYGGLGAVYVFASGNSGHRGDWAGFDEQNNHVGVVVACGVDSSGNARSGSSEPGPNLWVCGPTPGIFTTAPYGRYRSAFSGTSAAAPSVAGVAALVRGANADLSWRDIKVILANTARKVDATDTGWIHGPRSMAEPATTNTTMSTVSGWSMPAPR